MPAVSAMKAPVPAMEASMRPSVETMAMMKSPISSVKTRAIPEIRKGGVVIRIGIGVSIISRVLIVFPEIDLLGSKEGEMVNDSFQRSRLRPLDLSGYCNLSSRTENGGIQEIRGLHHESPVRSRGILGFIPPA